jgi:hypothetical protein
LHEATSSRRSRKILTRTYEVVDFADNVCSISFLPSARRALQGLDDRLSAGSPSCEVPHTLVAGAVAGRLDGRTLIEVRKAHRPQSPARYAAAAEPRRWWQSRRLAWRSRGGPMQCRCGLAGAPGVDVLRHVICKLGPRCRRRRRREGRTPDGLSGVVDGEPRVSPCARWCRNGDRRRYDVGLQRPRISLVTVSVPVPLRLAT